MQTRSENCCSWVIRERDGTASSVSVDALTESAPEPGQVCGTVALPNTTQGAAVECNARWFGAINHCPVLLAGAS
jgi:hypothetical protein